MERALVPGQPAASLLSGVLLPWCLCTPGLALTHSFTHPTVATRDYDSNANSQSPGGGGVEGRRCWLVPGGYGQEPSLLSLPGPHWGLKGQISKQVSVTPLPNGGS